MKLQVVLPIFLLAASICVAHELNCGSSVVGSGLIVGGSTIKRGQWPFRAALFHARTSNFFCGATIISYKHVITAAHCIQPKYWDKALQPEDITVHLGRYNISKFNESDAELSNVVEVTVHPDWNHSTVNYDADIAILRMENYLKTSNFIRVACWPTNDEPQVGAGVVVGWGFSENTNFKTIESIAQEVKLNAVTNEFCFLHQIVLASLGSNRTFCAGGEGSGPCHGDSGSGYFTKYGSNWYLQGITSSSLFDTDGKCDVTRFAVFTNVVKYTDWVDKIVSKKIVQRKFEFVRIDEETGKKYEAHSYKTEYHNLNGTAEGSSSISFKPI